MVSGSRFEGGNATHNLSAGVRKTIQSIKEIVGNHSDADIYSTLKETNMDPNETTQKLLNQDPFHEVKRRRDKKKEVTPLKDPMPRKPVEQPVQVQVQEMKPNTYSDRYPRRPSYVRNNVSDAGATRQFRVVRDNRFNRNENKIMKPPVKESPTSNVSEKSSAEASKGQKSPNLAVDSQSKQVKSVNLSGKAHDLVTSPSSSVVGVYSSSSDPVHIPSRPAANIGAIKREVGIRRHATEKVASKEQFRSFPAVSKNDQLNVSESVHTVSSGRSLNNQYSNRPHQQLVTHQKVSQGNKEWKPKSSKKVSVTEVGVIGTPKKSTSSPAKDLATEAAQLQDKLPAREDQNVIIAAHIRVSESDRIRLTFGSLGSEVDSPQNSVAKNVEDSVIEPLASLSVSSPDSSGSKQIELVDERVQSAGSVSPDSETTSEQQSADRLESSSSPQNMENYTNIGLPSEPQQQQNSSELPSFSQAYDPQTGYDMSYFRPATDESLRGQIPQEAFSSHVANSIPATTIPMVHQQQQPQMYPQVHFANIMPYRQFLSPVYVPPMVMPGYSNNPTYSPHPTSGSSYVLMPGGNSPHVNKYAIPQYKSLQAGSPTGGFGNFSGYNTPGSDDSSRIKYKDGNVYVSNPQGETSEVWMNPRDMQQSASYYNMAGQTPHAAYHSGHASFNAAAQSSHMQFPGMYQPHHMGGGVAAGGGPGTQVGGYQQPQLSWTGNF